MLKATMHTMGLSLCWPRLLCRLPLVVLFFRVVNPFLEVLELTVVIFQKLKGPC